MKHKVISKKIGCFYGLGWLLSVVMMGGIVALLFLSPLIFRCIIIAISIILGLFACFNSRRKQEISNYIWSISYTYRWSIRAALETKYPQGIIYIIGNTLKELEKFGINYLHYRIDYGTNTTIHANYSESTSGVRGFPNKTNLKAAMRKAEDLSKEWEQLNNVERIKNMEEIWAMIEKEDMWLDWKVMTVNLGKEIYWYFYDENAHRAIIQHPSNTISARQAQNELSSSTQPVFNPQTRTQSSRKILNYEEFLQQVQDQDPNFCHYFEHQKLEKYKEYLSLMTDQPPLSATPSSYPDNSNYVQEEKEDNIIW